MSVLNKSIKTARISVFSNIILTLAKLFVGLCIGSISIISEAAHSLVDLVASLIAYFAVKEASKPADKQHPYGYGKFENVSGTIEAILIFIAAIYIIYEAADKLLNPLKMQMPVAGVLVMFFSASVNFFISKKLFITAKKEHSIAIEADAWHLRTDVYTSLGVMSVLSIIAMFELFLQGINIYWLDSVAAIFVATIIVKTAYKLIVKSSKDLFDVSLPEDEVKLIEETIEATNIGISGYHALKTRKAGNKRFVEFHILVNPQMSVLQSHEITRQMKYEISKRLENVTVTVHVEPCDNTCTLKCQKGCFNKSLQTGKY
ncbi:MAG: cation diffusion facilitator family transporter [Endomicrobium sp.]|jgi:cation diffusion facilitator family transporter|nr:cation diffusion facilitator family transporter [Endomicrobium sp.]